MLSKRKRLTLNASYGVAAGGEAFASSVVSAMEGIVVGLFHSILLLLCLTEPCQTKPIQGAETEGALGFFKGVGKGLVG